MKKSKKIYKLVIASFLILLVTGCETPNFDFSTMCVKCGDAYFPKALAVLTRNIVDFIQLIVPVIIIILGMVDLLRAVMAGDEKKMDEVKPSLIKKIIAGVMIFLVVAIIKFAFGVIPSETNKVMDCISIFLVESNNENYCPKRVDGDAYSTKDDSSGAPITTLDDPLDIKNCADRPNQTECKKGENCKWGYIGGTPACYYDNPNGDDPGNYDNCKDYCSAHIKNPASPEYDACVKACEGKTPAKKEGCYRCTEGSGVSYDWTNSPGTNCYKVDDISVKSRCIGACSSLDKTFCNKRDDCKYENKKCSSK